MKFTYAYKTSDGVRHEDAMNASSREEVFERLRERGIKAIKVIAADGSKANGEIRGVRKRVVVASIAIAALAAGFAAFLAGRRVHTPPQNDEAASLICSTMRRQVIGDVAIIEKGIRTGWADAFTDEGDRFLASCAVPGVASGLREPMNVEALRRIVEAHNAPVEGDSIEVRQIKAIVEGMKSEAKRYLAAGGTLEKYAERLQDRQKAEIAIYDRVKAEIDKARETMQGDKFDAFVEERNDGLRNLGIRPVVVGD